MARKLIFTYWHSEILPHFVRACINTWKKYNPDFEVRIYNQNKFEKEFLPIPKKFSDLEHCHKADCVRLFLLEKYGGIWIDSTVIMVGPLPIFYHEIDDVHGFSVPWCDVSLENWFIAAPQNNHLISAWKKEFVRAIEMGFDNYKIIIKNIIDNLESDQSDKSSTHFSNILIGLRKVHRFLPYLTQHFTYLLVCLISCLNLQSNNKLDLQSNNKIFGAKLLKSIDGPYHYIYISKWNPELGTTQLFKNNYYIEKLSVPMIKLGKQERHNALTKIHNGFYADKGSIMDRLILPFYRNTVIIRTHDPSDEFIDKIIEMHTKYDEKCIVISLHLSISSYDVFDGMDCPNNSSDKDFRRFGSKESFFTVLPDILKNYVGCFVEHNKKIYHKYTSCNDIYDQMIKSSGTKLYVLKDRIQRLLSLFEHVHIYTDETIEQTYGYTIKNKDETNITHHLDDSDFSNISKFYRNECIELVIREYFKYLPNKLWVIDDETNENNENENNNFDFIKKYDAFDYDFLARRFRTISETSFPMTQKYRLSDEFVKDILSNNSMIECQDTITCFSGRFLKNLLDMMENNKKYVGLGHSKVTTPTMCKYFGMSYSEIITGP